LNDAVQEWLWTNQKCFITADWWIVGPNALNSRAVAFKIKI
jgi:hypothetical protein